MAGLASLFAALAIVPAMTSAPVPLRGDDGAIVLALCQGGSIAVSSGKQQPPFLATSPCCAKGCRSSKRRGKADRQS